MLKAAFKFVAKTNGRQIDQKFDDMPGNSDALYL
jgi:hypothetical protein